MNTKFNIYNTKISEIGDFTVSKNDLESLGVLGNTQELGEFLRLHGYEELENLSVSFLRPTGEVTPLLFSLNEDGLIVFNSFGARNLFEKLKPKNLMRIIYLSGLDNEELAGENSIVVSKPSSHGGGEPPFELARWITDFALGRAIETIASSGWRKVKYGIYARIPLVRSYLIQEFAKSLVARNLDHPNFICFILDKKKFWTKNDLKALFGKSFNKKPIKKLMKAFGYKFSKAHKAWVKKSDKKFSQSRTKLDESLMNFYEN